MDTPTSYMYMTLIKNKGPNIFTTVQASPAPGPGGEALDQLHVAGPVRSGRGGWHHDDHDDDDDDDDDDDNDDEEVPLEVETVMRKSLAEGRPVTVTRGTGELRLRSTAWTRDKWSLRAVDGPSWSFIVPGEGRLLLGACWKCQLSLSHLRHYAKQAFKHGI